MLIYNNKHGTSFDPQEALYQYLEATEEKEYPRPMEEITVDVDILEIDNSPNHWIH